MFSFLLLTGVTCIILGIYLNRNVMQPKINNSIGHDNLHDIRKRLDNIEKILFDTDMDYMIVNDNSKNNNVNAEFAIELEHYKENISKTEESEGDESLFSPAAIEKYRRVVELENSDYTLENICKELGMSKGEVILLKNLFKDY